MMQDSLVRDFSEVHAPTGALGPRPERDEDWQRYRLSDEQVASFHRDGYLAGVTTVRLDVE